MGIERWTNIESALSQRKKKKKKKKKKKNVVSTPIQCRFIVASLQGFQHYKQNIYDMTHIQKTNLLHLMLLYAHVKDCMLNNNDDTFLNGHRTSNQNRISIESTS